MGNHEAIIISRAQAREGGLNLYFSGKPCLRGHVVFRRVDNGNCCQCHLDRANAHNRANPEETLAAGARYRDANRELLRAKRRVYAKKNKQAEKVKRAARRQDNLEEFRRRDREYKREHPQAPRTDYSRTYVQERCAADLDFKLRRVLSIRVGAAVRRQGTAKSAKTTDLIGCTVAELRAHLEGQFTAGMTWNNHGRGPDKWNIDHKIPCSSFDLTNPEQQRACFHFTNLQPLWQPDNMRKGAKLPLDFVAAAVL